MKRHLLTTIGLMAILLATACHRKAAPQPPAAPEIPTTPIRPANEPKPEVYQVAGYQKTACFGKCPVYQVKFFTVRQGNLVRPAQCGADGLVRGKG